MKQIVCAGCIISLIIFVGFLVIHDNIASQSSLPGTPGTYRIETIFDGGQRVTDLVALTNTGLLPSTSANAGTLIRATNQSYLIIFTIASLREQISEVVASWSNNTFVAQGLAIIQNRQGAKRVRSVATWLYK